MSIPKYHEMYLPFLTSLKDGERHSIKEIKEIVAAAMSITMEERKELLPSGKQAIFDNRIGWTRTYLKKAGLISSPKRGVFVITKEGSSLLDENPPVINDELLMRYDSFRLFKRPSAEDGKASTLDTMEDTPQDILDSAFKVINANLAEDLLSEIMKQSPSFF